MQDGDALFRTYGRILPKGIPRDRHGCLLGVTKGWNCGEMIAVMAFGVGLVRRADRHSSKRVRIRWPSALKWIDGGYYSSVGWVQVNTNDRIGL